MQINGTINRTIKCIEFVDGAPHAIVVEDGVDGVCVSICLDHVRRAGTIEFKHDRLVLTGWEAR